jgi:hypothetical protein
MGYVIFQTHLLSAAPLSRAQKRKKKSPPDTSATSASEKSAVALTSETTTDVAKPASDSNKQLQLIQGRHNFQPLVFFLFAGVRGLFITSMDYQSASATNSMNFIEAMSFITQHSKTPHTPDEPIWKNLSAYLVKLFRPAFQSPDKILPLAQAPSRIKLAEAITMDFLNHWKDKQPSSPFLIPHSTIIHPATES